MIGVIQILAFGIPPPFFGEQSYQIFRNASPEPLRTVGELSTDRGDQVNSANEVVDRRDARMDLKKPSPVEAIDDEIKSENSGDAQFRDYT
jgi:hypothetical protein